MSIFKHQGDVSISVITKNRCRTDRRTETGVLGHPKNFRGKVKSSLFVALAAILATLIPAAGAQAQTTCPSITGVVTPDANDVGIIVGANQNCTMQSTGRINILSGPIVTAFKINGARSKVINYGNIKLTPTSTSFVFDLTNAADNVEIEFLSGSVIARNNFRSHFLKSLGDDTKLTFGGTALIELTLPQKSYFFQDLTTTDNEVILLP